MDVMSAQKTSCIVLYNLVGEDEFERLRAVDPATLPFKPVYPIHVKTAREEYEAIVGALRSEGFDADLLNIGDDLAKLQRFLLRDAPHAIFNLVEIFDGDPRLEAGITGFLDLCGIPYTGSGPFTLSLCQRKALAKHFLLQHRIRTPRFKLLRTPKLTARHGLRYPIILKPAQEDASLGVEADSVVHDPEQLPQRVSSLYEKFKQPILIEEFIEGRELHVSVIGNNPPTALPVLEYDFSALPEEHPAIITYAMKWNPLELTYHKVHSHCPAKLPPATAEEVTRLALRAYSATYCRDYARIDMRVSKDGKPYVLEVNPNPDLTEGVSFMESAERAGLSFSQTLRRILEFALARNG
jgi:D-alanine-D-alanine ligase